MIMVLLYKILSMTSTCVGIKKIIEKKWTQKIYLMNLFLASPMDQCKYVILLLYSYNSCFLLKSNMKFRKVNKKLIKGEFWLIKPETFFSDWYIWIRINNFLLDTFEIYWRISYLQKTSDCMWCLKRYWLCCSWHSGHI